MWMSGRGSRKEIFIPRKEFSLLFNSGNQKGRENKGEKSGEREWEEWKGKRGKEKEGEGKGDEQTNKKKKIPKSTRAEAPKQINVALATGGVWAAPNARN